jgi:hypothetical protein
VSHSTLGLASLRRLAGAYRRILVLAVPAADAGLAALNQHRILYSAQVAEEEYDLFSMGPDGGNVTHLTTFAGAEMNPAWSPGSQAGGLERRRNNKRDRGIGKTGERTVGRTGETEGKRAGSMTRPLVQAAASLIRTCRRWFRSSTRFHNSPWCSRMLPQP